MTALPFTGTCVLVTAGGGGIGRAIASAFAGQGAQVQICDIDPEAVAAMNRPNEGLGAVVADVADEGAVAGLFEATLERFGGKLDVLVNNAGIAGPAGPIEQMDLAAWDATFQVNVHGTFLCLRHAVPVMKAAGAGAIINIASTAGTMGYPLRAPYAAAKWAIVGLTKTLAMELGPAGIRVNAISPGSIKGPRMEGVIAREAAARGADPEAVRAGYRNQTSLRTFIDAEDIAEAALFLASPQGKRISGLVLAVDGHTETLSTMTL
ncbi:MAG: SDR family oxidoreductase [Pseudomonadota bacterium]